MKIKVSREIVFDVEDLAVKVTDMPGEFERFINDQENSILWAGELLAQRLREDLVRQLKRYLPRRQGEVNADLVAINASITRLEHELRDARTQQTESQTLKDRLDFLASQLP